MTDIEKAGLYVDQGKPSEAYKLLAKLKAPDAKANFLTAEALRMLGKFAEAITGYSAALSKARDPEFKTEILLGLAACQRTLGKGETAYKTALEAAGLAVDLDLDELLLGAKLEAALALRAMGRFDKALTALQEIFEVYRANKDYQGMGYLHWAVGGIYRLQGRFDLSLYEFKSAVALAKKQKDETALGYAYFGLAGVSRIAGNIADSEKYYRLADGIFKGGDDIFALAYVNCGLANALRQKGAYDEAYLRYLKADELYSSINDEPDLGFVKWGLGNILLKRGKIKEAYAMFAQAETLFGKYDEMRGRLLTQFSLASADYLLGNKRQAALRFDRAYQLARKEGLFTYLEMFT
ncbi:MAG: tetratricopeptide repeat protein [Elusimicrobiaceae bacterium]